MLIIALCYVVAAVYCQIVSVVMNRIMLGVKHGMIFPLLEYLDRWDDISISRISGWM